MPADRPSSAPGRTRRGRPVHLSAFAGGTVIFDILIGTHRSWGKPPARKATVDGDLIWNMSYEIKGGSLRDVRDKAPLTFGMVSCLRRSEITALDVSDVVRAPEGLRFTIRRLKTGQESTGAPIAALARYHLQPVQHPGASLARATKDTLSANGVAPAGPPASPAGAPKAYSAPRGSELRDCTIPMLLSNGSSCAYGGVPRLVEAGPATCVSRGGAVPACCSAGKAQPASAASGAANSMNLVGCVMAQLLIGAPHHV